MRSLGRAAVLLALLLPAAVLQAQDLPVTVVDPENVDLDWLPWISDVPIVDLSGNWAFEPDRSDPMIGEWRERSVTYEVYQHLDRIILRFRPGSDEILQNLTWTGGIVSRREGDTQIRERTRWTRGGRVFEVEGRWWRLDEPEPDPQHYAYRYELDGRDILVVTQEDEFGVTVWRFRRQN